MHVAELSLCKELFELSGWKDCSHGYFKYEVGVLLRVEPYKPEPDDIYCVAPAYSLSYLLRRLPEFIDWKGLQHNLSLYPSGVLGGWVAKYENAPLKTAFQVVADTPENAAAKLCIELFKQKILTRES